MWRPGRVGPGRIAQPSSCVLPPSAYHCRRYARIETHFRLADRLIGRRLWAGSCLHLGGRPPKYVAADLNLDDPAFSDGQPYADPVGNQFSHSWTHHSAVGHANLPGNSDADGPACGVADCLPQRNARLPGWRRQPADLLPLWAIQCVPAGVGALPWPGRNRGGAGCFRSMGPAPAG